MNKGLFVVILLLGLGAIIHVVFLIHANAALEVASSELPRSNSQHATRTASLPRQVLDNELKGINVARNSRQQQSDGTNNIRKNAQFPLKMSVKEAPCDERVDRCEQCYECRPRLLCRTNQECCSYDEICNNDNGGYCEDTYNDCPSGGCPAEGCPPRYECDEMGCNEVEYGNGGCFGPISPSCKRKEVPVLEAKMQ